MTNFYGQYVGFGAGGAVAAATFGGSNFGYHHGGETSSPTNVTTISRFSFASGTENASFVGDLSYSPDYTCGTSSYTNGYQMGGGGGAGGSAIINRYSFATDTQDGSHIANLAVPTGSGGGFSNGDIKGYSAGGYASGHGGYLNNIQYFSHASDADGTDIANMTEGKLQNAGATETGLHGYTMCGSSGAPLYSTVEKFIFATEADSEDIGDMTDARYVTGGCSSATHGYAGSGTYAAGPTYEIIDKFNFSGSFSSSLVGALFGGDRQGVAAQSSTTHGYYTGGVYWSTYRNYICRVDFSSDGDATDVGDLTVANGYAGGTQF